MANSSDWIAALERGEDTAPAGWLAQLRVPGTFVEGAPFGLRPEAPPSPACANSAATDPAAPPPPDPLEEAFARGETAGREAAERESAALGEHHRALRLAFRELDQAAMDALAADLCDTVIALCAKALEECAIPPERLLARCHEAARRMGGAAQGCTLHLHPDDAAAIDPDALGGWQVVPDPGVARSGLRLEGPDGSVGDGPAEWRRAIAAALKG